MELIAQCIGIGWCVLCIGAIMWTLAEYINLKNKKL